MKLQKRDTINIEGDRDQRQVITTLARSLRSYIT